MARCTAPAAAVLLTLLAARPGPAVEIPPPEKQIEKFKLPPGFDVQLVASDPDIGQPMNLNFDARGRLWASSSREYPYPAKGEGVEPRSERFAGVGDHPPRDRLTVFEGIGPDGKPAKVTQFAGGLNIPIGNTPLGDGSAALAYSIPAIYRFVDKDGDGKSDQRTQLYARFGNVDTHGMSNGYTRWIDGWVYGCHGFSNTSEITDAAGRVTKMRSGNTYRFREDGSHFEQFTWGQVNPFGLTFDPLGNLYSADCHTRPLYLLLRGARYPHFGDAPDGLGFGPEMMRHNHGSTGICGPAYYAADYFPQEYRDNLFVCNPVTGRINRDKLRTRGSTYECLEQPDFVSYDGNLFRPVDCIVGPDGAMYVADFCNPIIGHYEAPLDHPDRDRTHGRIWRIIWRGNDGKAPPPRMMPDLTKLDAQKLIEMLADPNLQVRTLATNYLVDAHAEAAPALAKKALEQSGDAHVRAHCLWVLERLGALDDVTLDKFAEDEDRLVRVHAMRILAERKMWSEQNGQTARVRLIDPDAFVRRAAADALGRHPTAKYVPPLLAAWEDAPAEDPHLIYTIRLALRSHLREPAVVAALVEREFDADASRRLVEIAAAADSDAAAPILLAHAEPGTVSGEVIQRAAGQIARHGSPAQLEQLLRRAPQWYADDPPEQIALLASVAAGLRQKGTPLRGQQGLRTALAELAPAALKQLAAAPPQWANHPLPDLPESASPWGVRHRNSTDGDPRALFWDSISHGERLTGVLRSRPFPLPKRLAFWMCGHNGHPNTNAPPVNHVRLMDAKTGAVLAKEIPPRNDTARQYTWTFDSHVGEPVAVEIVDAHRGDAYAWIGVGRFDPPVLRVPAPDAQRHAVQLIELIGELELDQLSADLLTLARDRRQAEAVRLAALESHVKLTPAARRELVLIELLGDVSEAEAMRSAAAALLAADGTETARAALVAALARSPAALQRAIALALVQSMAGQQALLEAIAAGKASPRLLQQPQIAEQLNASVDEADKRRIAQLTKGLPSASEQIAKLIDEYRASFASGNASPERGRELFQKHCAACHRIGEAGGMIGPQLDGVGNRGLDRLLEDVLDPNRNVAVTFRTVNIETVDGKILSGIERRREGKSVVIADQEGKERSIALADIAAQRRTNLSLMPANFDEAFTESELRDVLRWLLEQRQSP